MKLVAALIVTATATIVAPGTSSAVDRVIIGEFEDCQSYPACANIAPPTRLDIMMYPGTLSGQTYWTRCANMGGTIWNEYWKGAWRPVCHGVDY